MYTWARQDQEAKKGAQVREQVPGATLGTNGEADGMRAQEGQNHQH